jgi:hypothetical protein
MQKSWEKFKHLDNIPIESKNILKIPVDDITPDHLNTLKTNLELALNNSDSEVVNAAISVIAKIDWIINLWKTKISWEIMDAANNLNYKSAA